MRQAGKEGPAVAAVSTAPPAPTAPRASTVPPAAKATTATPAESGFTESVDTVVRIRSFVRQLQPR
ncbi:PE-PGRS family protein [Mycobacterium tuberculosis T92]|nr:PE-PGRS family protein [Mycobacterium tuberculosis T92]